MPNQCVPQDLLITPKLSSSPQSLPSTYPLHPFPNTLDLFCLHGFEGLAVAVALLTGVAVPGKTLGSVTAGTPGSVDPAFGPAFGPAVGFGTVWVDFGTVVTAVDCGVGEGEATVEVTVMVCAGAEAVTVMVAAGA